MPFPVTLKAADAKGIPLTSTLGTSGRVTTMRWPPGWDAWVPSPPGWGIAGRGAGKHQRNAGYSPASKLRFVPAPVLKPWDGRGAASCCCLALGLACTTGSSEAAQWNRIWVLAFKSLWNESKSLQQHYQQGVSVAAPPAFHRTAKNQTFTPSCRRTGSNTVLQTGEETWCQHWTGHWLIWAQSPTAQVFLW